MQTQTSSIVGRHGRTIVYDVHRPNSDPRGVVFLAHGLGEHAGRYGYLASKLTDAGYVVVVPDHAGHGRSGGKRLGVTDFGDFTADLHDVMATVDAELTPRFLVGHSMGGAVALKYALDHPNELTGLILSGPAIVPGADLPPLLVKIAPTLGKIAPWLPTAGLAADAVSRDRAVVDAYVADPLVWHGKIPAGLGGTIIDTLGTFPQRLPALTMPTLVLHGSEDTLAEPEGSRMVERLAGSDDLTVKILPGLYHEIFNEPERDEVIAEVTDWLVAHS